MVLEHAEIGGTIKISMPVLGVWSSGRALAENAQGPGF